MNTVKKLQILLFASVISISGSFISINAHAQGIDSTIKKVGTATKKTAKKVGNTTASVAVKGASKIADKTYKGKEGPNGETVYIDKMDRKYYVDDKGKKVYLKKSEIKDKPE
jgi:ABC-type microcin C transport system permease subunit YejB